MTKGDAMGNVMTIDYKKFPKQGSFLGKKVEVCFHYNTSQLIAGTIVRDDAAEPYCCIIKLDNGRYILSTECQYSIKEKI